MTAPSPWSQNDGTLKICHLGLFLGHMIFAYTHELQRLRDLYLYKFTNKRSCKYTEMIKTGVCTAETVSHIWIDLRLSPSYAKQRLNDISCHQGTCQDPDVRN